MSDTPQFYDPARYDPSNSVGLLIKQVMGMMRQEVDGRLSALRPLAARAAGAARAGIRVGAGR